MPRTDPPPHRPPTPRPVPTRRRTPTRRPTGERGQATPLLAIVLVVAGLLLVPTGLVIRAAHDRAQAQSAADAVALAGAGAGPEAGAAEARAIAHANEATIESYADDGTFVEVTVVVGGRRATARAMRELIRTRYPGT